MAEKNEKEIKVKSLQKALDILNCFTKKSSWGVTELSEYLDLNKSNVHSILSTFAAMEYLRQDEETGKYKLGMAIYTLCHALGDELIVGNIALPYMQELSNWSGERVYLGVAHEDEVIYVNSTYPEEAFSDADGHGRTGTDVLHRSWKSHDGLSVGKGGRRISQERTSGLYRLYDHRCRETKKRTDTYPETRVCH